MTNTLVSLQQVLVETLELSQAPEELDAETALFGALPELDSFGVVQLVAAIEEQFDIAIDDEEFVADLFETVGTLTEFIELKLTQG